MDFLTFPLKEVRNYLKVLDHEPALLGLAIGLALGQHLCGKDLVFEAIEGRSVFYQPVQQVPV
jgi:hypothetical protein